jgi:HAD superfamily hydrolase (TIGR01662 family)
VISPTHDASASDAPRFDVPRFDVVIPTIGRPSLVDLLRSLDAAAGPRPGRLIVVDDRPGQCPPLEIPPLNTFTTAVATSGGRGPAAARNTGWRRCAARWVAFLDDDVLASPTWFADLVADLDAASPTVGAIQGGLQVPQPAGRRPTDSERQVLNLEEATWITADMAIRRRALVVTGGFDERFRRAYREDTDMALRLIDAGFEIGRGDRRVLHPVRHGTWRSSVRAQRGNADDALMRQLHGSQWRTRGHAPAGMLMRHVVTSAAWAGALLALSTERRRAALTCGVGGAWLTGRLWWQRARQGPLDLREVGRMGISSILIPPSATAWAGWGWLRARRLAPRGSADRWTAPAPRLVLFDRDGTLVHDVPYNGEPDEVRPVEGARAALDRLRAAGVAVGIVTNQSGIGRGLLEQHEVDAVHARIRDLLGDFEVIAICPHAPDERCGCRKPSPLMVLDAAHQMGVQPHECVVIGDIGSDVEAGLAAGARSVLVPTELTLPDEVAAAPEVATTIAAAVGLVLTGDRRSS